MSHKMILLHPSFGSKEEKTHQQKASRDSNINIYYNRELIASVSVQNNNIFFLEKKNKSNLRLHFLSSSNTSIFMNSICFPPFSLLKGPNLFGLVDTSISKHRIPKILGHFHCMMWINIKPNKCTFFSYDPSILLSFYIHSVYS